MHQSTKKAQFLCVYRETWLFCFKVCPSSWKNNNNNKKNLVVLCYMHKMYSLLCWLVVTHSVLFGQRRAKDYWRIFESQMEIYSACFPMGHTPGLSGLFSVYQSMPPDLSVTRMCFYKHQCEGTTEAFQTWASVDVDIMYSSNFVTSSRKKRCYQWSEQTVSVPNEDEYVSLTNQHNLEEANVF